MFDWWMLGLAIALMVFSFCATAIYNDNSDTVRAEKIERLNARAWYEDEAGDA